MTAKEYLGAIKEAEIKIRHREEQLKTLRMDFGLGAMNYDAIKVQTSPDGDKMAKRYQKMEELEKKIVEMIERLNKHRDEIITQIDGMQNMVHADLLYKRYVEGKTFEQIAVEMNYSYWHVCGKLHPQALKQFEDLYLQTSEDDNKQ